MYFRNLLLNLLLALGALALVAGAAIIVLRMTSSPGGDAQAGMQKPAILVASHAIRSGSLLRSEDVAWKEIDPAGIVPGELVRGSVATSDYSGAVVRRNFASGEPLQDTSIVKPSEHGFLAAVLSPGDRAVTIIVGPSESASGLVLPGDYVDVILTQNLDSYTTDPARKTVSETVLHDVRVIALDRNMSASADAAAPSASLGLAPAVSHLPKTITLEVNEQQAQRLMVANSLGHIDLALRALQTGGQGAATSVPTWADDVSPALLDITHRAPVAEKKGASPVQAPVQILRGGKSSTQ